VATFDKSICEPRHTIAVILKTVDKAALFGVYALFLLALPFGAIEILSRTV